MASLVAVVSVVLVALDAPAAVRTLPAVAQVLVLPGYVLVAALLSSPTPSAVERLVMSVGGSIVIAILGGLALAWSNVGLTPLSWAVLLALITLIGSAAAWRLRSHADRAAASLVLPRLRGMDALALTIAAMAVVGIIVGTRVLAADAEAPPPAQLWMVPPSETSAIAHLGVRAGNSGEYVVRLTSAGNLLEEFTLSLTGEETWQRGVEFTPSVRERPIVARLYDADGNELRFVVLQPPTSQD